MTGEAFQRWLTPERLRLYPVAVLAGLVIGLIVLVVTSESIVTARGWPLGGDFFAFYAVSRLVLEGRGHELLSLEVQFQEQQRLLGDWLGERFLPIPYMPTYLLVLAPLAALPYRAAYLVHVALGIGAVVLAVRLLRRESALLRQEMWAPLVLALTFWPLVRGLAGGQIVGFVLLGLVGLYVSWARGERLAAGLWLGALLVKPQYALPFLGLFLLKREWRIFLVAAMVGAAQYVASALVAGWRWPWQWLDVVRFDAAQDAVVEPNLVSWLGLAERLLGPESLAALIVGYGLTVLTVGLLVAVWLRVEPRPETKPYLFAAVVSGMLLLALHVVWYDVALALLPLLFLVERYRWRAAPYLLALWLVVPLFAELGRFLPLQPLFLLPLATLALSVHALTSEGHRTLIPA